MSVRTGAASELSVSCHRATAHRPPAPNPRAAWADRWAREMLTFTSVWSGPNVGSPSSRIMPIDIIDVAFEHSARLERFLSASAAT